MAPILNVNEKIACRNEYNIKILDELSNMLKEYPELRFGQALINLGICEDTPELWFRESVDTYYEMNHKK